MKNTVLYSLLKYSYSQILGEELNVGILFIFPHKKHIAFSFPHSILRIKKAYPEADVETIRSYLQAFKIQAEKLEPKIDKYSADFNDVILEQFIVQDSSSLQFTKFQYALCDENVDFVKDFYNSLFLGVYESAISNKPFRKTDKIIVAECKKLILQKNPIIEQKLLSSDFVLKKEKILFKPDLRWQNGTLNLIKGVTLDYHLEHEIIDKALLIQNQLNYLESEIQSTNCRVDLLISTPQVQNNLDAYKYALEILKDTRANTKFIEEKDVEVYAEDVSQHAIDIR